MFHFFRPLQHLQSDRKKAPVALNLPLSSIKTKPSLSASGFHSTCLKAVSFIKDVHSELVDQLRSWFDMESYRAFKQVDSRSDADARAERILEDTTYHDGCRYQVGMLWAEDENSLLNNNFSVLVQLKSLERCLAKKVIFERIILQAIQDDISL